MLHHNPLMRVPVLLDEARGNQVVIDSRLIVTYLHEQARAPLPAAPEGRLAIQPTLFRPEKRYHDENVLLVLDGAIDSAINVFLLERDGVSAATTPYLRRQGERIERAMGWLEEVYAGRSTLDESAVSFVDLALVCGLEWLAFRKRYDLSRNPGLARVVEHHRERPSLASTHPSLAAG
jgi:glutathione S-transferase